MNNKVRNGIIFLVIVALYGGFLLYDTHKPQTGSSPVIKVPKGTLTLDTGMDQTATNQAILEGVEATDKEDGNITKKVFVQGMSTFGEGNVRVVTLGVFDKDDNYTKVKRKIQYTNYSAPQLYLYKALVYSKVNSKAQFADYMSAYSCVDGDLSSQVKVIREYEQDKNHYVTFAVTDSTGTQSSITLKAYQTSRKQTVNINLDTYLMRVKVGTEVNAKKHIDSITMDDMDYSSLKNQVDINTDYDKNTPGTYEFIYRVKTGNDDYGLTKLVVIVEE